MVTQRFGNLRGDNRVTGLVPVIPTPLNEDESLDEEGFEQLIEFVLAYPFAGIWALASAGEDPNLPLDKIEQATKLLVKYVAGRIPLIVKTSSPGLQQTIERTQRMADIGIDAAAIHLEQKALSEDHMRRYFDRVLAASPIPAYVYHNASRGAHMSVQHLMDLTHHSGIAGMKAGGSQLAELQRLCLCACQDASVLTAGGGQILAGLAMGAAGHTAIPLLAFPEKAFSIVRHLEAGRLAAARREQRVILDFLQTMPKLGNREVMGEVKAVLHLRGVMQKHVSAPFLAATEEQVQQFRELVSQLNLFEPLEPSTS